MTLLEDELKSNFVRFRNDWVEQAAKNRAALFSEQQYLESYQRLSCLQTIKTALIEPNCTPESYLFFTEAHNDALVSHVQASLGAWRSALQALRSTIENTLATIYYKDHPVELTLWNQGKFRIGFNAMLRYVSDHPSLSALDCSINGIDIIETEYATLSKAVHGSAKMFRMTDDASTILLWSDEKSRLGMWATRERKVLEGVCLLITCLYASQLRGTALPQVRQMLSFTISASKCTAIKKRMQITIKKS